MEWTAPSDDGGSPVTGYAVDYRSQLSSDSMFTAVSVEEDTRAAVLFDLSPFVTYDVQVRAVNAVGSSRPSAILNAITHPDG